MIVREVSLLAKKRYCELKRPYLLGVIYKIQERRSLSSVERLNYEQLEREILNIANSKASIISGLTRNNRKSARLSYDGCVFVVKYNRGFGKVVTIQRDI